MDTVASVKSITRLTLFYCQENDRVLMNVITDNREEFKVWLTHRVLIRLVPHVIRRSQTVSLPEATVRSQLKEGDDGSSPVTIKNLAGELVITSVEVSSNAETLSLVFFDKPRSHPLKLCLTGQQISRWIDAVKSCFRLANWSEISEELAEATEVPQVDRLSFTLH